MATVTAEQINGLLKSGKSKAEAGKELGINPQKLGAILKKAALEAKGDEDEFPAALFAKSTNIITDANMGGSVVLTGSEYREYSKANGRYDGRREGEETILNTGELRISMNIVKRGDCSGVEMRDHLLLKHGITEKDILDVAHRLTKEEEQTKVSDVAKLFRIKMP